MKNIALLVVITMFASCSEKKCQAKKDFFVADGQMPSMCKDGRSNIHLVYGRGDSIMYSYFSPAIASFTKPSLIAVVPRVFTFATRGPQIAATANGLVVTACTATGNIHCFYKEGENDWVESSHVNDIDTVAKEGLMALSADENNVFAVWLDLRGNKRNKIYGARSVDGGKTWAKNVLVYTSPDTTVCECCKPSVVVKNSKVYVMFRNWLHGNRDLYVAQSDNNGNSFKQAQKLGTGSWLLDGCPMDGGALAINKQGQLQTVWRRADTVYQAVPGMPEKQVGIGKSCTIETVDNTNVFAWVENGEVVVSNASTQKKMLGKGNQPVLKVLNNDQLLCVWEKDKQIHASILAL